MKLTTLAFIGAAFAVLASCNNNQSGNPYGAPTAATAPQSGANPYAVPQANGETGANAPYQQLPGVGSTLPPTQPPSNNNPYSPPTAASASIPTPSAPVGGSTLPHTVVSGDSLWKLARDYNTTVEAIQAANGISGTNIRLGQTIQIPNN